MRQGSAACAGDKLHVVHCLPGQPVDVLSVTGMGVPVERLPYRQQQKFHVDHARDKLAEMYSDRMASAGVRLCDSLATNV